MATVKCGTYVRPDTFKLPGAPAGLDGFYKTEAWQFWVPAEVVKLEVGNWVANAQGVLAPVDYSYFYEKFQKMRADFDAEWPKVKGYSDRATFWCKYISRGMQWDTQFRALRAELKDAIDRTEAAIRQKNVTPQEQVKQESTKPAVKERQEKTQAAVEKAAGNTEVAAQELVKQKVAAGTVGGGMAPLDIALWIGGGVVALGLIWSLMPANTGGATAGLGRFGRSRRRR